MTLYLVKPICEVEDPEETPTYIDDMGSFGGRVFKSGDFLSSCECDLHRVDNIYGERAHIDDYDCVEKFWWNTKWLVELQRRGLSESTRTDSK